MSEFASSSIAHAALWILLAFSVASWALIVLKGLQAVRAGRADRRFDRSLREAADLDSAARLIGAAAGEGPKSGPTSGPKSNVAAAFLRALTSAPSAHEQTPHGKDLCERVLAQRIRKERRAAESGLAVLASIGATAPFVGLFGTVFGIIHALTAISHRASASIDVVAGPIGEALVATGVGIAVAVPAVLAYNFFVRRSKWLTAELDDFANDLITLAERQNFRLRAEHRQGKMHAATAAHRNEPAREAVA